MRWRAGIERAVRRVRGAGLLGWFRLERDVIGQVARTSLSAALAWALASHVLGSQLPALASLAAIITSQVTVSQTLRRAAEYVAAVVLGVLAALALADALGAGSWSVGVMIFLALSVGRALRLGQQANQVAVSALLVLSLGVGYGAERAYDALLGAVLGVLVNLVLPPPTRVEAIGRELHRIGEDLGALCQDLADILGRGEVVVGSARSLLHRGREITDDARDAEAVVRQGQESVRYNLRGRMATDVLARHAEALDALTHAANQVRGMCRTLHDMARGGRTPSEDSAATPEGTTAVLTALAGVLVEAATAVRRFGQLQAVAPDGVPSRLTRLRDAVARGRLACAEAGRRLESLPATAGRVDRELGSLLVDAERVLREVDPDAGPHAGAIPPGRAEPVRDRS